MPTVLLLNLVSSLGRLIAPDLTRQDIVQRCVLHFLRAIEELQPHEPFSLVTCAASSAKLVVPFTRAHSLLRSALYDVQLQEQTALDVGLKTAFEAIEARWGLELPAQVVIFTDDSLPEGAARAFFAVHALVRVRVHLVAF